MSKDPVENGAKRGLDYVLSHPAGISYEFNILSKPGQFPPFVIPVNKFAEALDNAISGKDDYSGATYAFTFGKFLNKVEEAGGSVRTDWTSGKLIVSGPKK